MYLSFIVLNMFVAKGAFCGVQFSLKLEYCFSKSQKKAEKETPKKWYWRRSSFLCSSFSGWNAAEHSSHPSSGEDKLGTLLRILVLYIPAIKRQCNWLVVFTFFLYCIGILKENRKHIQNSNIEIVLIVSKRKELFVHLYEIFLQVLSSSFLAEVLYE